MDMTMEDNQDGVRFFGAEQANLHTHSAYCGHGRGKIGEFVEAARQRNLRVLGMSEHCPVPGNRWSRSRMDLDMLATYMADVDTYSAESDMVVLKAVECDYLPEYHDFYRDEVMQRYGCHYMVGAVHFVNFFDRRDISIHNDFIGKRELARYTEHYVAMLQSGLFLFGAHPDVFGCTYVTWDAQAQACSRAIIEAAKAANVPLELNGNGFRRVKVATLSGLARPYPIEAFWEMAAEAGVKVVTNSDAHIPEDLTVSLATCLTFAANHGLEFTLLRLSGDRKPRFD
jgi:histidinol-phosphatase (PHP family)